MVSAPGAYRFFLPLLSVFFFLSSAQSAQVTVSGRRLLVDGEPFVLKAVNYSPIPSGRRTTSYNVATDAAMYNNDFPLLKTMGVNTLRLVDATAVTSAFLDAAHANGLYVVMGYYVNTTWDVTNGSTQTVIQTQVQAMVDAWKSHPSVLMWSIGNEVTTGKSTSYISGWYSFLNTLAGSVKGWDASHPVTTAVADVGDIGVSAHNTLNANPSNLDLWGVNIYRGSSFGNAFTFLASTTTKPVWFHEFGADAYRTGSGEDQDMQSFYLDSQLAEIKANLSSSGNGILVGGSIFEWSDEWWKGAVSGVLGAGGAGGDAVQDGASDWSNSGYTLDTGMQEEWWGVVAISSSVPLGKRLRKSYYTIKSHWNPAVSVTGPVFDGAVTNAPNPVTSGAATRISFSSDHAPERVNVDILDAAFRKVVSLPWSGSAGAYYADWQGVDTDGRPVSPGVYIARVEISADGQTGVKYRKIAVVR
jgi:hypothetical protein